VEKLRAKYEVGLIPGHFFEMPKHFRLGFGGDHANLQEGLARLSEALHAPD
jgi:aspartate/methionine/tyrosine aminotransferase